MTELDCLSRRRFLWTAGANAVIKGCPLTSPSDLSPKAQASLSAFEMPEATQIKFDYFAIVESASLIAQKKAPFVRRGIKDVALSQQPPLWDAARDNVEIGLANSGIDGERLPMPHIKGLMTKGNRSIPKELSRILAQRKFFNVPPDFLHRGNARRYQLGDQKKAENLELAVKYWKGGVSHPDRHDAWFLTESLRSGVLPQAALSEVNCTVDTARSGSRIGRRTSKDSTSNNARR